MSGATTATYIAIAAATAAAAGSIYQGQQAKKAADRQADIDDRNAVIAQQASQNALLEASSNEDAQRRKSAQQLSAQAASLAESGIGLDSGTASDLTEQSALNAELDALNIRYAGKLKAAGYSNDAASFGMQASASRASGSAARTAGYINAGASALSSYGSYQSGQAKMTTAKAGVTG